MTKIFLIVIAFVLTTGPAHANDPETVRYPIQYLVNLQSRSAEKTMTLVSEVTYPNGCYLSEKGEDAFSSVQGDKIVLAHFAMVRSGLCTMALVPKLVYIDMPTPQDGRYLLVDSVSGDTLGVLTVINSEPILSNYGLQ